MKLADLVLRGSEEAPPKVTIHLPPTPAVEAPPPIPVVKIQPKVPRPLPKPPVSNSPAIGTPITPRIKLLPSGSFREPAPKTPVISEQRKRNFAIPPPKRPQQPEKKKAVSKPQTAGMSVYDLGACRNALKKVQTHKRAKLFLQPVDPVRDRAPELVFPVIRLPLCAEFEFQLFQDHQKSNRLEHDQCEAERGSLQRSLWLRERLSAYD